MNPLPRLAAVVVVAVSVLSACGGEDPAPAATVKTPAGFELPAGVELTPPDTTVDTGEKATFVYDLGSGAASAVTASVDQVRKGDIEDFTFFTLDEASKSSTPYYVTATLTNNGPAGLGATAPPFVVHDDGNSIAPPNTLNGEFKPCAKRELPESLLPGKSAEVCMVFLLPKGRGIESIDSMSDDPEAAIHWKP